MAAPTYSEIPSSWVSGDQVTWAESFPDYPATTWTLTYYFRALANSSNKARYDGTVSTRTVKALDVVASASGLGYSITVSSTNSATLFPGRWSYAARVVSGSEAHTVKIGYVDIAPNLQAQTADTYDSRTEAEYNLALVNDAIRALLTGKVKSYSVAGRSFTYNDLGELRKQAAYWAGKVAREKGTGPQVMLARYQGLS